MFPVSSDAFKGSAATKRGNILTSGNVQLAQAEELRAQLEDCTAHLAGCSRHSIIEIPDTRTRWLRLVMLAGYGPKSEQPPHSWVTKRSKPLTGQGQGS